MQTTFFGTYDDILNIWGWFLEEPEMQICELNSRQGKTNRHFRSVTNLPVAPIGLAAWSPAISSEPVKTKLREKAGIAGMLGLRDRIQIISPAFLNLVRNNDQSGCLATSYLTSWNEKGARQRSHFSDAELDSVDWKALSALHRKIARRIKREATGQLHGYAVLPDAWTQVQNDTLNLWWQGKIDRTSPELQSS